MKKATVWIMACLLSIVLFSSACSSCGGQKILDYEQEQLKKQEKDAAKSE